VEENEDPFQEEHVVGAKRRAHSSTSQSRQLDRQDFVISNNNNNNNTNNYNINDNSISNRGSLNRRGLHDPQPFLQAEPSTRNVQSRPAEIPNLTAEVMFILVCSTGQLLFGFLTGNVAGLQLILVDLLDIPSSQTPWLLGSFLLANGLSVIVSGSLADLYKPKYLICGAFAWQTVWNVVGIFSLHNKYLFFLTRGGQGLSVGILVSSSISVLGRIYQPGLRKTRVFSIMASMAPLGYWLGNLQGGALYHAPKWIFATSSVISGLCLACSMYAIPNIQPALQDLGFRSFDFVGSALAVTGCALLVAGLTQGPSADWAPYAIGIVGTGLACLVAFFFVEQRVQRPLLPPALWRVPGFTPLILSYL
jgi:MFS family permease